jgi:serine/threonine protein kinase
MDERMAGLSPTDFNEQGALFFSTAAMDPPTGFGQVWHTIKAEGENHDAARALATPGEANVALVFVNLSDMTQVSAIWRFLSGLGEINSVLFLVPHSTDPKLVMPQTGVCQAQLIPSLLELGFDDVILGDARGFRLAAAFRARLASFDHRTQLCSDALQKVPEHDRATALRCSIDEILWSYLRQRMQVGVPPMDPSIAPGEPHSINGFEFGAVLGMGAYGKVFKVKELDHEVGDRKMEGSGAATEQVVKCIAKSGKNLNFVKCLKNEIRIMQGLSTEMAHPNIPKLYALYHSCSHIFLRMEYGGPENLQQRLASRDELKGPPRKLSLKKAASVILQCIDALAYLHTGPMVVHRDIKPANIIVSETQDDVHIFLTDFGLAKIVDKSRRSRQSCGTLPFMAPELVLEETFNLFAADVWSMGVLFLEILCFDHFVQRQVFKDNHQCKNHESRMQLMERLYCSFATPGSVTQMLLEHAKREYQGLLPRCARMLDGMLDVDANRRLSAKEVAEGYVPLIAGHK